MNISPFTAHNKTVKEICFTVKEEAFMQSALDFFFLFIIKLKTIISNYSKC